jgi:hypothetical protein
MALALPLQVVVQAKVHNRTHLIVSSSSCCCCCCPSAGDARDAAAEGAIDLKHGAKKVGIRAETNVEEGKEKSRSWIARLFGRGKVRSHVDAIQAAWHYMLR